LQSRDIARQPRPDANSPISMRTFSPMRVLLLVPVNQPKEVPAMQTAHLSALEAKHAVLDQRLAEESHRPLPDALVVADLKKQKLRIKEEIAAAH
jgi:hypothetical protein